MRSVAKAFARGWSKLMEPNVTLAVVFAGIVSNTASELGYVVLVPLGAVVFLSMGRHPLAGLAAAFAGVSGGYSANLLIGTIDPLLAGLTQEAAQLIAPGYMVHAAVNYYFMFVSVFVITAIGTWVTLRFVEPFLGKYDPSIAMEDLSDEGELEPLTSVEKRGLLWTLVSIVLFGVLLALTIVPEWGILRNPETGDQLNSPFFRGIVTFIFVGFVIPGFVYGKITGSMKGDRDIVDGMAQAMSTLGLYIVIVFFAAQFVAFFGWTNLGQIVAVTGAQFLEDIGLTGPAGLRRIHLRIRLRQPDAGLCICAVGCYSADLRADADADGIQSGGHPGRVSYRGFRHEYHHTDDELFRTHSRVRQQVRPESGHRDGDLDDAAVQHPVPARMDGPILHLGIPPWSSGRPRAPTYFVP
jgi:p-aminobenzoyl-glutamate transporter AbgT